MVAGNKVSYLTYYADVKLVEGDKITISYVVGERTIKKKVDKSELIKIGNGNT